MRESERKNRKREGEREKEERVTLTKYEIKGKIESNNSCHILIIKEVKLVAIMFNPTIKQRIFGMLQAVFYSGRQTLKRERDRQRKRQG